MPIMPRYLDSQRNRFAGTGMYDDGGDDPFNQGFMSDGPGPSPSFQKDSMVPPPMPPPPPMNAAPMPPPPQQDPESSQPAPPMPPPGMAGPQPPVDPQQARIQALMDERNALKRPEAGKPSKWQMLAAGALGGLQGYENKARPQDRPIDLSAAIPAVVRPKATAQMNEYGRKVQDIDDRLKMADAGTTVLSKVEGINANKAYRQQVTGEKERADKAADQSRTDTLNTNRAKLLDAMQSRGEKRIPFNAPTPPGMEDAGHDPLFEMGPDGKPAFKVVRDPHFGKVQVTPAMAQSSGGILTAGQWVPEPKDPIGAMVTNATKPEAKPSVGDQKDADILGAYAAKLNKPIDKLTPTEKTAARLDYDKSLGANRVTVFRDEHAGESDKKEANSARAASFKAFQPTLDSAERFNVMAKNYEDAMKTGDQQAMLSLLANHLGMTMGLQKGARLTKDIITEAIHSRPYLQGLAAKFDHNGYLSGVTLTPEQMRQMVHLGRDRFAEDAVKSRSEAKYMGSTDDGPERTATRSTINFYTHLANGNAAEAKKLAAADGWSIK